MSAHYAWRGARVYVDLGVDAALVTGGWAYRLLEDRMLREFAHAVSYALGARADQSLCRELAVKKQRPLVQAAAEPDVARP